MKKKYETPQAEVVKLKLINALLVDSVKGARFLNDDAQEGDFGL